MVHSMHRRSARRRAGRIVAGAVMTAGSFASTGAQPAVGSAPPPVPTTTTTTTVPPPVPPAPATTTTTTTTTVPPPAPTTTTTAAPRVATDAASRQQQAEAIADGSGWDWRAAGVRIVVAYHPQDCCHWGVYDSPSRTLYIGPSAFAAESRARYVVLHELGHAWQYQTGRFRELIADYQPFGMITAAAALEAGGDCIAALWGASDRHYWACPAEARATAARRLAGDWG